MSGNYIALLSVSKIRGTTAFYGVWLFQNCPKSAFNGDYAKGQSISFFPKIGNVAKFENDRQRAFWQKSRRRDIYPRTRGNHSKTFTASSIDFTMADLPPKFRTISTNFVCAGILGKSCYYAVLFRRVICFQVLVCRRLRR